MKPRSIADTQAWENYTRPTPEQLITDGLSYRYTKGGEFTTVDGDEYVGEYHIKKNGKVYSGPTPSTNATKPEIRLLPYYSEINNYTYDRLLDFDQPLKQHTDPIPYEYIVQEETGVYSIGYDTRYFVQKIGIGTYAIEIDSQQRNKYGTPLGIDDAIYKIVDLQWQLTGTLDVIETINKQRVNIASQTIPDLPFIIRNYTQFARPTNQTQFSSIDSQLVRDRKFLNGPKPSLKQTYDKETGTIIKPQRLLRP